jgi:bifunctional oligoribonuclease and PAP phosphatase NrnA
MQDRILHLDSLIGDSYRVLIVTHTHPDGDAIGSSTALASYLRECRGKQVCVVIPNPAQANLNFLMEGTDVLDYSRETEEADGRIRESDLIFCLDAPGFHRTDALEDALAAAAGKKVLIDHHPGPSEEQFCLIFSQTQVSSASELLFQILMGLPDIGGNAGRLPSRCARSLMCGMTTDTNNFANSVFPSTLEMASQLLAAGVDRDEILSHIYQSFAENRVRLIGYLLSEKLQVRANGLAYMILTAAERKRFDCHEGDTEGIVNMPLAVGSVRMSLLLTEDDGFFRVSIRSKRGVSANACARKAFNGGGHEQASGGRLYIGRDIASAGELGDYIERNCAEFLL